MFKKMHFTVFFLVFALLLQGNHAVMFHTVGHHKIMPTDCGGEVSISNNSQQCVCCVLKQTDKAIKNNVGSYPSFLPAKSDVFYNLNHQQDQNSSFHAESPSSSLYKWISTVVQRK